MIYKLLYSIIANDVKMFDKVSILLFDINDWPNEWFEKAI
jgi:hypothetical protein